MKRLTAKELIEHFHLEPLEGEGGYFRSTYVSGDRLSPEVFSDRYPPRSRKPAGTAILYLITPDSFSRLHRLPTDEIFHFYLGDPVQMLQIPPQGGEPRSLLLGQDIAAGMQVQALAPARWWQGTRLVDGGEYALLGTTMAPGYTDADYEDADREQLQQQYPAWAEEIAGLCLGSAQTR